MAKRDSTTTVKSDMVKDAANAANRNANAAKDAAEAAHRAMAVAWKARLVALCASS